MPVAAPRVCARCRSLAEHGQRCGCRPAFEGSGRRDSRVRRALRDYRNRNPRCEERDCPRLADQVDHIVPLAELGESDPRRYGAGNLQSLCNEHHKRKTTVDALRGKTRAR